MSAIIVNNPHNPHNPTGRGIEQMIALEQLRGGRGA